MDWKTYLADTYRQAAGMLQMHLADFTEAEMVARPCDVANHASWQLGHLCVATTNMINLASPGALPAATLEESDRYSAKASARNEAGESKEQLLKRFMKLTEDCVAWMQKLSDAELQKPLPDPLRGFAPVMGNLAMVHPVHIAMHIGQVQVIRRKLGKPVLF